MSRQSSHAWTDCYLSHLTTSASQLLFLPPGDIRHALRTADEEMRFHNVEKANNHREEFQNSYLILRVSESISYMS